MKWRSFFKNIASKLWFRATLFGIGGLLIDVLAWLLRDTGSVARNFPTSAVDDLLQIIATSMLMVTTFSLSAVIAAYSSASTGATPRATSLLMEDTTAQNALATFIGAFIFSIVGIISLRVGVYGDNGRLLLFIATVFVIVAIVFTLIRWINHVITMGRLPTVITNLEKASSEAIRQWQHPPRCGTVRWDGAVNKGWHAVTLPGIGYVQHVDLQELDELAEELKAQFHIAAFAGKFNNALAPALYSSAPLTAEAKNSISGCFDVDENRSFEQDPRFGLIALSEVASRALSPAVNDPGTAIDIIGRAYRLLSLVLQEPGREAAPKYANLSMRDVSIGEFLDDVFTPIARDGASTVEVGIRLMKAYVSLLQMAPRKSRPLILAHAKTSAARFDKGLAISRDKAIIRALIPKT